jgi:hypothetical protein
MGNLSFSDNAFNLYKLILTVKFDKTLKFIDKRRNEIDNEILDIKKQRIILAEKNSQEIYPDEIYKALDKGLENRLIAVSTANNDGLIKKYEIEAVLNFSNTLFRDPYKMFLASNYGQRRFLIHKFFPKGLIWGNNSFSNTKISPILREIKDICDSQVAFSGRKDQLFEHLEYLNTIYLAYQNNKEKFNYV